MSKYLFANLFCFLQVAKLLMDTSILQFYPTLFVLVTDIMDMLGDLVWQRIKQKAEFSADGTLLGNLPGISSTYISLLCKLLFTSRAFEIHVAI